VHRHGVRAHVYDCNLSWVTSWVTWQSLLSDADFIHLLTDTLILLPVAWFMDVSAWHAYMHVLDCCATRTTFPVGNTLSCMIISLSLSLSCYVRIVLDAVVHGRRGCMGVMGHMMIKRSSRSMLECLRLRLRFESLG
jgi:hypothetical protein